MQKISIKVTNNNPSFSSDNSRTRNPQNPINQPIKDEVIVGSSADISKKPVKKRSRLLDFFAVGALIGVGIALVAAMKKGHSPIKKSYFDSDLRGGSNTYSSKARTGGGGSSSGKTASASSSSGYTRSSIDDFIDELNRKTLETERLFNKFENDFKHSMSKMTLDELKTAITNKKPQITNFDNPSQIVSTHFPKSSDCSDDKLVFNMYSLIKKQVPNINDPAEALRTEQCGASLLINLRSSILFRFEDDATLTLKKIHFFDEKIGKDVDETINKHFKRNLPPEIKNEIKDKIVYDTGATHPYQLFANTINSVAEKLLTQIAEKHVVKGRMTPTGEVFFTYAEKLNSTATKMNRDMQATDDTMNLRLGSVERTINNYRYHKFESGRDEFWDEYFEKKRNNSSYGSNNSSSSSQEGSRSNQGYRTYTSADVNQESFNIFKNLGEDLGDPKTLTMETLKKAYRRLLMKYHPDKSKAQNAQEVTRSIIESYEALASACVS